MIETLLVLPRKSSVILGNLRKFSKNVRKRSPGLRTTFEKSLEILGKCSEIFENSSKTSLVCFYNKQNIYMPACGYEFYLRVFNLISRVEHSKIKFVVSTRGHLISSISFLKGCCQRIHSTTLMQARKPCFKFDCKIVSNIYLQSLASMACIDHMLNSRDFIKYNHNFF